MISTEPLPAPGETLVIEASAGTGKTWTISTLAARFIAERGVDIASLAIVTFSSASAAEVRGRTRARLVQCAEALGEPRSPDPDADPALAHLWSADPGERLVRRRRLLDAVDDFDLAPIMTTHGFCDHLLWGLGILADHDPTDRLVPDLGAQILTTTTDHYLRLRATGKPAFSFDDAVTWVRKAMFAPDASIVPAATNEAVFVEQVRRDIEAGKRRHGIYTFDDMLARCRDALHHPSTGDLARTRLSQSYPVLLVDEFQDTDSIQWQIIRTGFIGASTVVLIGDPKQSIYGFRGADVSAYLTATEMARVETLDTNRRSSAQIVEAVGAVMNGARLGDPRIQVTPVKASTHTPSLMSAEPWDTALRLRVPADVHPRSAQEARDLIDTDLVRDLLALLDSRPSYRDHPDAPVRPLQARDIAVVVATNVRGNDLLARLQQNNIPAVFTGTESVMTTRAAQDWLTMLRAVDSGASRWFRAASLTSLVGWDLDRLVRADADEFADLASMMRRCKTLVTEHSPLAMLEWLTEHTDLATRLSADAESQRTWRDLEQLARLLSQPLPPLVTPVQWLSSQMVEGASQDESTRRLSVEADAVRVLTVHQSKGLQFPIVYLPQLADRHVRVPATGEPVVIHDASGSRVVDLGLTTSTADLRRRGRDEDSSESLRACYVALTRASVHMTAWWVPTARTTQASPLHRLLFRTSDSPADQITVSGQDPRRLTLPGVSVETIPEDDLASVSPRDAVGRPVPPAALPHTHEASGPPDGDDSLSYLTDARMSPSNATPPEARPSPVMVDTSTTMLTRPVDRLWRRTSFSALTAAAHQEGPRAFSPADVDTPTDLDTDVHTEVATDPDTPLDRLSPMADLPGGTAFGSLVHSVFEYADPSATDLTGLIDEAMSASGYTSCSAQTLAHALTPGLRTPLGPIADDLCLAAIPMSDRMAEMGFELPLSHTDTAGTISSIAHLLRAHIPSTDPLGDYPERLASSMVDSRELRGYLTGSIDVVLRVNGRYLVVDYKTNRLGPIDAPLTLRHYTQASMASAMMASHYPLQALLYCVALHRFLRWRLPDYDPQTHLGGVAYLFVRGMAGPDTPVRDKTPCGVFPWKPSATLIESLSDLLAGVSE
ncbi:MAG: UvrD-helicase domain-containing protein [Propionibacteriaceae bacterium]|nr:UvrD-helicase domain-containing protein [Propionibacteriaceae bacterium]